MPAEALKCKECRRRSTSSTRSYVCDRCFGPLEVSYDHSGLDDPAELRRKIQAGPHSIWRYADFLPFDAPPADRARRRLHAADPLRAARRAARRGGGLRQERRRQPDPLVQGPGRERRGREGAGARLRGGRLRLDREPRQRGRRARGGGGPRVLRLRARPTSRSRRSSRPASTARSWSRCDGNYDDVNRLCTELSGRAPLGVRERQPAPLLRRGLEDARRSRSPSSSASSCPTASCARSPRARCSRRSPRGFEEWLELGLLEGALPTFHGAQADGLQPGRAGVRGRARHLPAGAARTRSPSRLRSATRPTACSRSTWRARPAARSTPSPTRRSSTASSCSPRRPASSPRPPAASRPRC